MNSLNTIADEVLLDTLGKYFLIRYVKIRFASQLFQHTIDDVMGHEWLTVILADVPVHGQPGLTAQEAVELAGVIILYDDGLLARERIEMTASAWKGTIHLMGRWLIVTPCSFSSSAAS